MAAGSSGAEVRQGAGPDRVAGQRADSQSGAGAVSPAEESHGLQGYSADWLLYSSEYHGRY